MKTHLLTSLLLFTSSVIVLGADRGVFRLDLPDTAEMGFSHFHVGLLDSTINPNKRSAPLEESSQPQKKQYENCCPEADLYLSSSEKFDASFCETIVLHLVTETRGKTAPDTLRAKLSGQPSLRRLNVMLQV